MEPRQAPPRRSRLATLGIAGLVVWVLVLAVGIVAVMAGGGGPAQTAARWNEEVVRDGDSTVAMIEVTGEIVPGRGEEGLFSAGGLGADDYVSQLRQAMDDDDVKGVIVRLDTPGGGVVASDEIYRAVVDLRARKPVLALMSDVAASGGYYVAAGATYIMANPTTITGSIGVIAIFLNLAEGADKLGVRPVVIKSGRYKDLGSPFRDMEPDERELIQDLIDETYGRFVRIVAQSRKMGEAEVRRLADGRIYSGSQAKELDLVDELGGFEEAVRWTKEAARIEDSVRVVRYVRPALGLGDALFGLRGGSLDVREAITEASGAPSRPGLHYLWVR